MLTSLSVWVVAFKIIVNDFCIPKAATHIHNQWAGPQSLCAVSHVSDHIRRQCWNKKQKALRWQHLYHHRIYVSIYRERRETKACGLSQYPQYPTGYLGSSMHPWKPTIKKPWVERKEPLINSWCKQFNEKKQEHGESIRQSADVSHLCLTSLKCGCENLRLWRALKKKQGTWRWDVLWNDIFSISGTGLTNVNDDGWTFLEPWGKWRSLQIESSSNHQTSAVPGWKFHHSESRDGSGKKSTNEWQTQREIASEKKTYTDIDLSRVHCRGILGWKSGLQTRRPMPQPD